MNPKDYNFHLPWRKRMTLVLVSLAVFISLYIGNADFALIIFQSLVVPLIGIWIITALKISKDGITINRFFKLKWSEIIQVSKYKFLGISHLKIQRLKGSTWTVPLYLIGKVTIRDALLENVPHECPLYEISNTL